MAGAGAATSFCKLKRFIRGIFLDYNYFLYLSLCLVFFEFILGQAIIRYVKYTEIDWEAYMSQVEGFLSGELDYMKLKGGTGPLVYPAGFLYLFSVFYYLTEYGKNIWLAQQLFLGIYLVNLSVVLAIYYNAKACPPWVAILLCLSRRIHSIFYLRLFNDTLALLLVYIAIVLFQKKCWNLGSLLYSLGVSVKMNIFLFAPAVLLLYFQSSGMFKTIQYLAICALVQVVLGLPFLFTHPIHYLGKAFEFSRVFFYKWTVNWKLIPEEIFLDKRFAFVLLTCHVGLLVLFFMKWGREGRFSAPLDAEFMTTSMFVVNFIGIAVSRTLHYQFYSWYYFSLPYLLWQTNFSTPRRIALLVGIEYAFNAYPSNVLSSSILQLVHILLLIGVYLKKGKVQGRLCDEDRNKIVKMMNEDYQAALIQILEYYSGISTEAAQTSRMIHIDEEKMVVLTQSKQEIQVSFGQQRLVDSLLVAQSVINTMAIKASTALEKKETTYSLEKRESTQTKVTSSPKSSLQSQSSLKSKKEN